MPHAVIHVNEGQYIVLFNQLFELGILEKRIVGVLTITAPIGTQAEKDIFILLLF